MAIHRAYAVLEIKAAAPGADGKRRFTGIATTPTADMVGDIVEPKGAKFKLPIPLCWMHDSTDPIGWVTAARVTDKGIEIEGEVANIVEPASLKERLDTAWAMLNNGLVRGLSIGFNPLESIRIEGTYSYRYVKWQWLELSPVTIACNTDCSITAIKSADEAIRRAAFGALPVVRLNPAPAATGKTIPGDSGPGIARRKGVIYLK